ncbi:hypothetical protein [Microbacter margulisiae]|uniref:Porin n=1 Tax=Microbacter margulisiae TaxID=1350067 RepID=A0A7W5DQZ8_9PORP|nr:hypothetical protein [Microbacter margulisiae]MBB3187492.1 hypothetical protein [Microbacter margulisiae]
MKKFLFLPLLAITMAVSGQQIELPGQQFEQPKLNSNDFTKLKVHIGGDFALQYQDLQNVGSPIVSVNGVPTEVGFMPIGSGVNLPSANMVIKADVAPGMRVVLTTYLASRHHNDTWVKGGYLQMDALPFIKSDLLSEIMKYVTIKVGDMEVNYGDAHLRRSDNGNVTRNAFAENYIMEAFMTAPAAEFMFRNNGWIGMVGVTGGSMDPSLVGFKNNTFVPYYMGEHLAFYGKVGFDKQFNKDFRLRFTVSPYLAEPNPQGGSLYNSDRAGARYYSILVPAQVVSGTAPNQVLAMNSTGTDITTNQSLGHWGPGMTYTDNSLMVNLFAAYQRAELFTTYEVASGTNVQNGPHYTYNQFAVEGIYHMGDKDQYYLGARYNEVSNQLSQSVNRVQLAAGWYLTKNILLKAEYVDQKYHVPAYTANAGFKGLMVESGISF